MVSGMQLTSRCPAVGRADRSFKTQTRPSFDRFDRKRLRNVGIVGRNSLDRTRYESRKIGRKTIGIHVDAFLGAQKEKPMKIELDFYRILHVSRGASKEAIYRAYERAVNSPPQIGGFSEHAMQARKDILDGALETLGSSSVRMEYDERLSLGAIEETVPGRYVAGALILLHEAEDYDAVIKAGTDWLASNTRTKPSKDVATIVGCSYLSSSKAMIEARESLAQANAWLEQARKLIQTYNGSYDILSLITEALEELGPRLALEMLTSKDHHLRREGVHLLPTALKKLKNDSQNDRRSQQAWVSYLDRVRQILTADELIELFNVSENLFSDSRELYYVAVAHIAAGCHNYSPKLIVTAKELVKKAERLAEEQHETYFMDHANGTRTGMKSRRALEEKQRRDMALCCAELLLGDSGAAADALGLRDDPVTCDRQIYTFVKNNSRGAETLLPGLCVLVERWIIEVALSSFYKEAKQFNLNEWFEDPSNINFIEALTSESASRGVLGAVKNVWGSMMSFFMNEQKFNDHEFDEELAEEGYVKDVEGKYESIEYAAETLEQGKYPESAESIMRRREELPVKSDETLSVLGENAPTVEDSQKNITESEEAYTTTDDLSKIENEYLRGMNEENMRIFGDDDLPRTIDASSLTPIGGEEVWMRKAYDAKQVRWGRVTGTAILVALGMSLPLKNAGFADYLWKLPLLGVSGATTPALSKGQAFALISKWQRIKADALGKRHSTENLNKVLGGTLVGEWSSRAQELKSKGMHYVHDSHQCKIDSVRRGKSEKIVEVEASIKENVIVYSPNNEQGQSYPSSYKIRYELTYSNSDGWKVTGSSVSR